VPDIPALLARIPDEFKPIAALGLGAFILVCLVLFHGAGLHQILTQHKRGERRLLAGRPHLVAASLLFGWSVFLMLCLHIVEITTWAFVLTYSGLVLRAYDALYFCANAYTTLGFGNVDLADKWRNISPIIGISGLFTFAWTTSALVTVVTGQGRLIDQLEDEREQEKQLRATLTSEEWGALKKERDAEKAERQKTLTQAAGTSFFQRRKTWKEEKERVAGLRRANTAEIEALRQKERQDEEKLGAGDPAAKPGDKK